MRFGPAPPCWRPLWLEADGFHLYTRVGSGSPPQAPAVVLVHGMVVSSRYMVPLIGHLAPHFRVYAPDLPGYGRSQKVPHALSPAALADILAAWLAAAGLDEACFVGNSYGCNIIAELAVRHPRKVTRAVLQGPPVEADARGLFPQLLRLMKDSFFEPYSMGLILARDYAAAGVRLAWETVQQVLKHRIEERLPDMQVPTMVVRGSRDAVVSQRWAEEVTGLLPDGRLQVIPGAAHTLNYAMPLEFSRVLRPFLAGGGRFGVRGEATLRPETFKIRALRPAPRVTFFCKRPKESNQRKGLSPAAGMLRAEISGADGVRIGDQGGASWRGR